MFCDSNGRGFDRCEGFLGDGGEGGWVENNGFAFKKTTLHRAVILSITPRNILLFPFALLPLSCYNRDLTWRCWDEKPDIDTLAEEEWAA